MWSFITVPITIRSENVVYTTFSLLIVYINTYIISIKCRGSNVMSSEYDRLWVRKKIPDLHKTENSNALWYLFTFLIFDTYHTFNWLVWPFLFIDYTVSEQTHSVSKKTKKCLDTWVLVSLRTYQRRRPFNTFRFRIIVIFRGILFKIGRQSICYSILEYS